MKLNHHSLKLDKSSFQLGMINCFVEMVACGVKKLALSPPLAPSDYQILKQFSAEIVMEFKIHSYLEKNLLQAALQSEDFTRGKWSILYYREQGVLDEYLKLKEDKERLIKSDKYNKDEERKISFLFMKLLSYPDNISPGKTKQNYSCVSLYTD